MPQFKTAENLMLGIGVGCGWSYTTMLSVALEYIERQDNTATFEDFLTQQEQLDLSFQDQRGYRNTIRIHELMEWAKTLDDWRICPKCGTDLLERPKTVYLNGYDMIVDCPVCSSRFRAPFVFTEKPKEIPF